MKVESRVQGIRTMALRACQSSVLEVVVLVIMFGCVRMEGVEAWSGPNGWNDAHATYYGGADASGTQGWCRDVESCDRREDCNVIS